MHRRALRALLADYCRRHPEEGALTGRFIDFVEAHPDCFHRELAVGHVTGSAWLVDRSGERVLLTHHRKLDIWVQLGGHADGCPDLLAVALAEAREESGLEAIAPVSAAVFDLDIHRIPARGCEPAHDHYDVRFALQVTGPEDFRVGAESHDLAWVPVTQLETYTREASMRRMAAKWRAQKAGGPQPARVLP
ncbi:MAG: NUDIX hydrolase [Candidatus Competibacterales bacterium]|nr:NUDIX hydrolase [Candidatus Competibacterales bacterium]